MRAKTAGGKRLILAAVLAVGAIFEPLPADASASRRNVFATREFAPMELPRWVHGRYSPHAIPISCVPFARRDSGIAVIGNAYQWWNNAVGRYARGNVPEEGSVLNFRANTHMRLGHVAVVSRVINPREIEVDQANWPARRGVTRGTPVVDVSEYNDWTAVRVEIGHSGKFGNVYPTYGFIYDRADDGTLVAAVQSPAPEPKLNPAPAKLRPIHSP